MVNYSTVSEFEDSWAKLQEKWNETASGQDVIEVYAQEGEICTSLYKL